MQIVTHQERLGRILGELDGYDLADQVANHLRALDVTGEPGDPNACPLAEFVAMRWLQQTGIRPFVMVDSRGVIVYTPEGTPTEILAELSTPSVLASFMRRFDADAYLDLQAS